MRPQVVTERDFRNGTRWDCVLPIATFEVKKGARVGINGSKAEIIPYQLGMTLWGTANHDATIGQLISVKYPQNESWINGKPASIWCYTEFHWGK